MKKSRVLALILAAIMLLSLLAGCSSTKEDTAEETAIAEEKGEAAETAEEAEETETAAPVSTKKTDADTFVLACNGEPGNWDPGSGNGDCGRVVWNVLFDRLIEYDEATNEFSPSVATDWEWSEDYLTLTLHLRDDVYFTNGDQLTGEDVIFTMQHLTNHFMYAARVASIDFDNSYVEDDFTVVLKLLTTDACLISNLADVVFSIVPKAYFEEVGADAFGQNPIGSGPFAIESWTSGDRMTLTANEDYWGEKPSYSTFVVRFIEDGATRAMELETGYVDAAINLDNTGFQSLQGIDGLNTYTKDGWDIQFFGLSSLEKWEPLQDINVRQAIFYAIDMDAIINIVYGEAGKPDNCLLPYNISMGYVELDPYPYDVEKAKELIAATDWTAEDLTFTWNVPNDNDDPKVAEAIQSYLKEIGITVNVEEMEHNAAVSTMIQAEIPIGIISNNSTANDPEQILTVVGAGSGHGVAESQDQTFRDLLTEAKSEMDTEKRAELYEEALTYIHDQYWYYPMVSTVYLDGCWDYVEGFVPSGNGVFDATSISFK